MKAVNYSFHSSNPDELDRVYSEYEFLGRNVRRFRDKVVVYAYPRKAKPKARPETTKAKSEADKTRKPARTEQASKSARYM